MTTTSTLQLDLLTGRATITVTEAAQLLGISRTAAYEAARRGELPTRWLGHRLGLDGPVRGHAHSQAVEPHDPLGAPGRSRRRADCRSPEQYSQRRNSKRPDHAGEPILADRAGSPPRRANGVVSKQRGRRDPQVRSRSPRASRPSGTVRRLPGSATSRPSTSISGTPAAAQ